jgi:hypothetical protein
MGELTVFLGLHLGSQESVASLIRGGLHRTARNFKDGAGPWCHAALMKAPRSLAGPFVAGCDPHC